MAVLLNPPRIAVIGGGIGGLTVAAALARAGLRATIYERTDRPAATGAGIQLAPNATRLLHRLGLADQLSATAVRPDAVELRRWADGVVVGRTALGARAEALYGAPYYVLHRGELHRALTDVAPPVQPGTLVGLVERTDEVELRFADGTATTADLAIGADGLRSTVRPALVRGELRYRGLDVHRGLVHLDEPIVPVVRIWLGPGAHVVSYPVSRGGPVSFAAVLPSGVGLHEGFDGWHADVTRLLSAARSVTRWGLFDHEALPRWCSTRIALLGDAAHPMLPLAAQGAGQAIEDAFALAACLRDFPMAEGLARYQALRLPRLARVVAAVASNVDDHHLSDGPAQRARDRAAPHHRDLRSQDWLYDYDAERTTS